ncbi:MAG: hypothetical protein EBU31_19000 [Proteobacteria bacterium]|nr:hypothetical protein [Pseudomonadota bacterium]
MKLPAAASVPSGRSAKPNTVSSIPTPNADHVVPWQRAMQLADTLPTLVKLPPTARSPFASAPTTKTPPAATGTPEPIDAHAEPFQRATAVANTPPAEEKEPPATRSPSGSTASEATG